MLLIDAHEDLAYNMLRFGRDYTRAAAETRRLESGGDAPAHNGDTLLGWPDYQRGQTAVVFGTLFAAPRRRHEESEFPHSYADIPQARRLYSAQLDAYHRLADQHPDQFCLIENKKAPARGTVQMERVSSLAQPGGAPSAARGHRGPDGRR